MQDACSKNCGCALDRTEHPTNFIDRRPPRLAAIAVAILCALFAVRAGHADESQLQRAVALYAEGRFQEAAKLLEQARGSTQDAKLLGKILLQLGITYAVLGEEAKAKQAFESALERDPTISVDPEKVKPSIVELFKAAKGAPKGRLSVRSTPPGAEVLVDGIPVGKTPLDGARVLAGQRVVEVSLSGYYGDKRSLAITENQESRFEVTLTVRPSPVRPGTHPLAASLLLGGAIAAKGPFADAFVIGQEFGAHFSGRASGFYLGLALSESFGSKEVSGYVNGYFVTATVSHLFFTAGLKLAWDIQLSSRLGLYLTPMLLGGYAHIRESVSGGSAANTWHVGAIQPGIELKLMIVDRLLLTLRPVGLEILVAGESCDLTVAPCTSSQLPDGYLMRYHLSLGIGGSF